MRYIGYLKRNPNEPRAVFIKRAKKHKGYLKTMFSGIEVTVEIEEYQAHYYLGR